MNRLPAGLPGRPQLENSHRFRVRYGETDAMGVVYYAVYVDWFAEGRTELLRQRGVPYRQALSEAGIELPVLEVHCTYHRSARFDDEVDMRTRVVRLTPTRLDFDYRIFGLPAGHLLADGYTRHAFVDAAGRPVRLDRSRPELWRRLIAALPGAWQA